MTVRPPRLAWPYAALPIFLWGTKFAAIDSEVPMRAVAQSLKKERPAVLRHDLRETNEPGILLRRAIVGSSLVGIACMAITTLFQTGMVKHLADPPIEDFDSDKVNASDLAYSWGMPDSPLSI